MKQISGEKTRGVVEGEDEYSGSSKRDMNSCLPGTDYSRKDIGLFDHIEIASRNNLGLCSASDNSISQIVDRLLHYAIEQSASDIHVEPREKDITVRLRRDGQLYPVLSFELHLQAYLVSRLKLMSGMDITEKRMPQDGRFAVTIGQHKVDFRVSTLPTLYGEKVVIRILDPMQAFRSLQQLGLSTCNYNTLKVLCRQDHGLILVTGPTGSGKTTTLYALINEINQSASNIVTLEDPVEYSIPGVNQVQVSPRSGLSFAAGLRSILRQDPDIIMVGEIRDVETAQLAVHAAMTGHLVLSTLHTNSAVGTISRLVHMEIKPYLLAASLAGIVSQRLVRVVCDCCRQPRAVDDEAARRWGLARETTGQIFVGGRGCSQCWETGYRGRVAIQEVLAAGQALRDALNNGKITEERLRRIASESGMVQLREDGIQKAQTGVTTLEEVFCAVARVG